MRILLLSLMILGVIQTAPSFAISGMHCSLPEDIHITDQSSIFYALNTVDFNHGLAQLNYSTKTVTFHIKLNTTSVANASVSEVFDDPENQIARRYTVQKLNGRWKMMEWTSSLNTANEFALTNEIRLNCQE